MIRRGPNVAPQRTSGLTPEERKLARVRRFWLDLNARLVQARKHGITLADATRRLEARETKARDRSRRRRTSTARSKK
jgi:hypothetical protein